MSLRGADAPQQFQLVRRRGMARDREESRSGGTAVEERSNQENAVTRREGNGSSREGNDSSRGETQRSLTRWPSLLAGSPASPWELMRRMSEEMNQLVPHIE